MWSHLQEKGIKLPKIDSKQIDEEIVPVLRKMEKTGIKLDVEFLNSLSIKVEEEIAKIEKKVIRMAGVEFNLNSPTQLAEILFEKLKLPTLELKKNRKSGGISTAASELKKIENKHEIIPLILRYREITKLLSTYLKPLPLLADENGRVHTTYGQDTTTGRMNSLEPNLQNIPIKGELGSEVRKAFIAEKGMKLISSDYSQIELRIVACLSDDTAMIEAFTNNIDIHTNTAAEIFNVGIDKVTKDQRRVAKTVNFGVLYGMSPYGLSQALSIPQAKAAEYITKYFDVHRGIKDYCNKMIKFAHENEYVETLFGFRRNLAGMNSSLYLVRDSAERMAINAPIQGTAADVLKIAMINLDKKLEKFNKNGTIARMLLTVHDELVIEASDKIVQEISILVKETMENAIKLNIPLTCEVEVGKNWGEMEKLAI